jgi:hypothetical protein
MRSWTEKLAVAGVAAGLLAAGLGARAQVAGALPIRNLRLPLERWPGGGVKMEIQAVTAQVPPRGPIVADTVRVRTYDESGKVDMTVAADTCTLNRDSGTAISDGPVRVQGRGLLITGEGFRWNAVTQEVRIVRQARVEFSRDVKELKGIRHGR